MIDEVHQYIDFNDGKFNTNPAHEFLRRRNVEGNTENMMSGRELADYMIDLDKEVLRLDDKYANDKIFKHKMDMANKHNADINNEKWRNNTPNNPITKDSGLWSDLARLFK